MTSLVCSDLDSPQFLLFRIRILLVSHNNLQPRCNELFEFSAKRVCTFNKIRILNRFKVAVFYNKKEEHNHGEYFYNAISSCEN